MNNGFEEWGGYMEAKITKLEEQFSAASNPFRKSDLFQGISIYVNGLTNPSSEELKRLMMVHGGIYHHYERSHTTYIIASNLPDVKVRNMNTSKIISPQWVVDCIKEQRILDYTRYLLYTNQKTTQPSINFVKKKKEEPPDDAATLALELATLQTNLQKLNEQLAQNQDSSKLLGKASSSAGDTTLNISKTSTSSATIARTAVDPRFLSEFFNNSRLHHIATLGAGFKQYISDLRDEHANKDFPARVALKQKMIALKVPEVTAGVHNKSYVMHIDMDCFFVSVGLRKHPHLRGQPVAVTHSKGGTAAAEVPVHPKADRQAEMELFAKRFEQHLHNNILSDKVRGGFENKMSLSEIASASYEARAKGVRNGMFVGQALQLCPDLKTIPYDFEGYREVAYNLYNTIAQYTLNIEAVSCDEMFVDLSDVLTELQVEAMDFVRFVREEVREKTQCPCSAGVGANKLQARMATKRAKPDGQYQLQSENVEAYMADIPIKELPGVGSSTDYTLKDAKLVTCGDLQKVSLTRIQMLVGKKFGETLHQFCRGIDQRGLCYSQVRKSVSAEVNYGIRFQAYSELETFLRQLCLEVHSRLLNIKRKTKCITLKLMVRAQEAPVETSKFMGHGVCDNVTKSVSLNEFTNDLELITKHVLATMKSLNLPPNELRGIGIQLNKLDNPVAESAKMKDNVIKNMFSMIKDKQKTKINNLCEQDEVSRIQDDQRNLRSADAVEKEDHMSIKDDSNEVVNISHVSEKTAKREILQRTATSKRGRKAAGTSRSNKTTPNIMGMLKMAAQKKPKEKGENSDQLPSDIDPEVFKALPEDIKQEILRERGMLAQKKLTEPAVKGEEKPQQDKAGSNVSLLNASDFMPSTSSAAHQKRQRKIENKLKANSDATNQQEQSMLVDPEFLAALPEDLRLEVQQQINKCLPHEQSYQPVTPPDGVKNMYKSAHSLAAAAAISGDNIFAQPNCLALLLAWIQSADSPENYDIELMCRSARELVRAKNLNDLYESLVYLGRVIRQQRPHNCSWHLAFRLIEEAVQAAMAEQYEGRRLFIATRPQCDKCEYNHEKKNI